MCLSYILHTYKNISSNIGHLFAFLIDNNQTISIKLHKFQIKNVKNHKFSAQISQSIKYDESK